MKNKRNLALVALITSGLLPTQIQAWPKWNKIKKDASTVWSNTSAQDQVTGGLVVAGIAALGYGIYRLFRAPSNEQLCNKAQEVYNTIHGKYESLKFVKFPNRMKITQAGYLFELTGHKDLSRIHRISADLPQLKQHITILSARINKNQRAGKSDYRMNELYKRMRTFAEKLEHVNKFWNTHAKFFTMHEYLTELSNTYSQYDYNNPEAVRMQVRGNATSKRGDAYTYPFKTFATELARNINSLQARIQNLRKKARSFTDRELIANDYYNMMSQAEPFCQSLVYLRDVAANQPEYAIEMQQYEKAEQKRAKIAAQERAAAERAQTEREKAEATRYKAHMDYLAKVQKQPQQTNVTVVNQTAAAESARDGSRTDNNNA